MIAADLDHLLPRYREELDYLRHEGAAFAKNHPEMAAKLQIDAFGPHDPHVERLIESFAWLSARLRNDLDAKTPSIARAMLDVLYPQLTSPVPSMAIAAFEPDPQQARATAGLEVPRHSELFASSNGQTIRWRTTSSTRIWPIEVGTVELKRPSCVPAMDGRSDVASVLHIKLRAQGKRDLAELKLKQLRLHLAGSRATTMPLYDLICGNLIAIAIVDGCDKQRWITADALNPAGFNADEAILPYPNQAHDAYRLLHEHFTFPEKYLFVDLALNSGLGQGREVDLYLAFDKAPFEKLMPNTSNIRLGCTPIANLFWRTSEPIRIDHSKLSYRIEPDSQRPNAVEIHSIHEVWCKRQEASTADRVAPLFSSQHNPDNDQCYWHGRRVPGATGNGHDMQLAFIDPKLNPQEPASDIVFSRLLCTNRGLAEQLSGGTRLSIENDLPLAGIELTSKPTRQLPARLDGDTLWQLVSHLSLNHLSLTDGRHGLAALKEILGLYGGGAPLEALIDMKSQKAVRRLPNQRRAAFCHGLDVTLDVDPQRLRRNQVSAMLLGGVLSHFLGQSVAANAFIGLEIQDHDTQDRIGIWPARAGNLPLL